MQTERRGRTNKGISIPVSAARAREIVADAKARANITGRYWPFCVRDVTAYKEWIGLLLWSSSLRYDYAIHDLLLAASHGRFIR